MHGNPKSPNSSPRDVTLQINLSPGDIAYAELTVPELVRQHRASVGEALAIVDCCRPQQTKIVDAERRFPSAEFAKRVDRIGDIAEGLHSRGIIDRVVYLRPEDTAVIETLSKRYTSGIVRETHDYGGCALMSYLAGLEVPQTRYVLHYDADMLLYQEPGYDWSAAARALMAHNERVVAASPRISPPFSAWTGDPDGPSRTEMLPFVPTDGGWLGSWFSTRCFLMDRERLGRYLPLTRGRMLVELLAVKYLRRGYPRSPEIMLYRRIGLGGGRRLDLDSDRAWLLHPHSKPVEYLRLLPQIMEHVRQGIVPLPQRGIPEIDVAAWEAMLTAKPAGRP